MPPSDHTIQVDQLQIGVYVYLDVGWMNHPFSFNNFKIRDAEQLRIIRQLGLKAVRWDPARSDAKPLPAGSTDTPPNQTEQPFTSCTEGDLETPQMREKRQRIERLNQHHADIARVEQAFTNAASIVRNISKNIFAQPENTIGEANRLIGEIVDTLLAAPELAIQVMAEKPGNEDVYLHSLNVSVLAMTLARELKLPPELVKVVGVGSLFHDIGLNEIPSKILNNPGQLSKPERDFREQHCQYGLDISRKAGLPTAVQKIVFQHHEYFDGSGYPQRLKGEAIDPLARLVALVNIYDNLCNPVNLAQAMTPHEALSLMFAQQRTRFDPRFLQAFIRFMGVYPPGSVVQLSNDAIGLVIRVNSARPLRPSIILYESGIPKAEAIILDLNDEPDINISKAIRPAQLPAAIYDYLSPRKRVSYYFDANVNGA
ncbi:HD domain-containing phosphohydrolase [Dechloromonas sp. ZY10]|uniref:HD-GYP domain-containing protein n=1 Tax=Dechloromonas aquae TaxID=2664436 RepID=UPI003527AA2C